VDLGHQEALKDFDRRWQGWLADPVGEGVNVPAV
jgi:hypothetical protein